MVYLLLSFLLYVPTFLLSECPFHFNTKKSVLHTTVQKTILPITKQRSKNLLFGDYAELKKGIIPFFSHIQNEYNPDIIQLNLPFSGIFFPHYNVIFCPELAKQILYDVGDNFIKGAAIKPFKKLFAPEGITFMETGARWQTLHAVLQDGPFNPRNFPERYGMLFKEHFESLIHSWHKKYPNKLFDLYKEITQFTMSVIADAFFNYRMSEGELAAVVPAFKCILDYIQSREMQIVPIPKSIPTKHNRLFAQCVTLLNNFYKTLVKHDPEIISVQGKEYKTIIKLLKEYTDPDTGIHLTDAQVVSHIGTLFFAGHDTTANLIAMTLYQLNEHKKLRAAITDDIHNTFAHKVPSYIPLGIVPSLDMFLQEIIRLYPSAPIITRQAQKDVYIGNYFLPKKSIVIIPILHVNRHPDYFKEPTTFNPNRFMQSKAFDAFIPFGAGYRRCLGQWFALAEARSFIVQLLTSDTELFLTTTKEKPIDLKMTSTGLPNQTIYAMVRPPKPVQKKIAAVDNSMTEMKMEIIDKHFENDAHTIVTLRLQPVHINIVPHFYPGDYLTLFIEKNNRHISSRHYSISSSPTETSWVEITTKYEESGIGSEFIHNRLAVGDQVTVRMPLHDMAFLPKNETTPLVLISGGIGITPMISIIRFLVARKWSGDVYCIHATKTVDLLPFKKELTLWQKEYKNIHQYITVTQDVHENFLSGRFSVEDINTFVGEKLEHAHIIMCGTDAMTKSISHDLIISCSMQEKNIHVLSFGALPDKNIRTDITRAEVAQHNTHEDAWIIIDNKVFDITRYITQHPGFDVISDYIGTDGTEAFYSVGHSGNAQRDMSMHPDIIFVGYVAG